MSSSRSLASTRPLTFASPLGGQQLITADVPLAQLNDEIMDTAFVTTQYAHYPGGMDALKRDHRFAQAVPLSQHWAYKYLLDLDGMSYSGRFMSFLASGSVPLKSTIYEEFYTDWIEPWSVVWGRFVSAPHCFAGFISFRCPPTIKKCIIYTDSSLVPPRQP